MKKQEKFYTVGEEIFNSVSHGVGALLSIIGATVAVTLATCFGDGVGIASALVYGLSLVVLYTMSTLYHAFPFENVKKLFRIFDHSSIFLLIAGSYTPICAIALRENPKGKLILTVVWVCAIAGVALNAVSLEKFSKVSLILYVAMGWAVCFIFMDVVRAIPQNAFWLLLLGGIAYTGGIIFYKSKTKYMHSVWHLFVLAGSIFHYLCIVLYILPMNYIG